MLRSMHETKRGRRRLLSIGAGAVAFTAIEGLACGNPVEPPCSDAANCVKTDTGISDGDTGVSDTGAIDTGASDASDASGDTGK